MKTYHLCDVTTPAHFYHIFYEVFNNEIAFGNGAGFESDCAVSCISLLFLSPVCSRRYCFPFVPVTVLPWEREKKKVATH